MGMGGNKLKDSGITVSSLQNTVSLIAPDQIMTGGVTVTPLNLGTVVSGTLIPDTGACALQYYTNGGAHTLSPGVKTGSYLLDIVNNASAGTITTTGWTFVSGSSFDTTSGHKFRCSASVSQNGSLLVVQAMQ